MGYRYTFIYVLRNLILTETLLRANMNFLNNNLYLVAASITATIKFKTFTRTLYSFSSFHFRNATYTSQTTLSIAVVACKAQGCFILEVCYNYCLVVDALKGKSKVLH